MGFKSDAYTYENLWRENFELHAAVGWYLSLIVTFVVMLMSSRPKEPFLFMMFFSFLMALWRSWGALKLWKRQNLLKGRALTFITVKELADLVKNSVKHSKDHWIGKGFIWEKRHTQMAYDMLNTDFQTAISDSNQAQKMGSGWIHGIEPNEIDLWQPLKHVEGHTLIIGVPGSGKTRLFDLLVSQCIDRGESVLIIDPKGDKELRENARRACKAIGAENRFFCFHPAFPDESVSIDPLKNFTRPTELASRIAALLPQGGSAQSFSDFAWKTVSTIVKGILMCNEKPSLVKIYHYVKFGSNKLFREAQRKYLAEMGGEEGAQLLALYESELEASEDLWESETKYQRVSKDIFVTRAAARFYREYLMEKYPNADLEDLINQHEHDQAHYSKMITNLQPILEKLTSGIMSSLMSPDSSPLEQQKTMAIFDNKSFLNEQCVVFIGLDALSDVQVSHAIGSLLLSDLASVAGSRFNFMDPSEMKPINIFVDEASEVLNEPFIQLLNKGRGAAMRLFVATQTISDFTACMGDPARANQILGNINNKFALRTTDTATQKYLADHMPKTRVKQIIRGQGVGGDNDSPLMHSGHLMESMTEQEVPLFAQELFGMMPNLEYLAFVSGGIAYKGRIPILVGGKEQEKKHPGRRIIKTDKKKRVDPLAVEHEI